MKKIRTKSKRIVAVVLCAVLLQTTIFPGKCVFATPTLDTWSGTYADISWQFFSTGGGSMDLRLWFLKAYNNATILALPTKQEIIDMTGNGYVPWVVGNLKKYDCVLDVNGLGDSGCTQLTIPEDYSVFPNNNSDYNKGALYNDKTIESIFVDTKGKNGFEMREAVFANMEALKTVEINTEGQTIQMDGSVFANCKNLQSVKLKGDVTIQGGFNFAGCTSLKSIEIDGNVIFSGCQEFADCSNLSLINFKKNVKFEGANILNSVKLPNAEIIFGGEVTSIKPKETVTVANATGVAGTYCGKSTGEKSFVVGTNGVGMLSNVSGIDSLSFRGQNSDLSANFITNSTIANLNIEGGTTILAEGAITKSTIDGMSFNATTRVGKGALVSCQVKNMYFNTSDVKSSGDSNNGAIGRNTRVKENIYFNHYDFFRNSDKVTALDCVPLGTGEYSLNCQNIYFLSPNFNQINQSPYDSSEVATNVYGYGGTLSTYDTIKDITAKEMFEKWTVGSNSTYHNIVQLTSGQQQGVAEKKTLYVEKKDGKAVFDLSSLDVKAMYNENIKNLDQLPTDEAGNVRQGEFRLKYTKDPNASTNFNYKVLTEATDEAAKGQYTYTVTVDNKEKKYITCQEDKLELGLENGKPTTYHFYVQAAGETWPLDVMVEQNEVVSLEVSINKDKVQKDEKIHLTVGDNPDRIKEYITVIPISADGKKRNPLDTSQYTVYTVRNTELSTEPVTVQDTKFWVYYNDEVRAKIEDVQVHEKKLTSFDVACDKANMPIGSQLTLDDVTLTNGTYENPLDTPIAKINKGYRFLQDGQETDVYTIKSGENKISVTYEGCVEEIAVTGVSNQVKDYEINCNVKEVELYQKSSLDISEVVLEDVVYADESLDGFKVETVKSGFTFVVNGEETDTVKLEDGENTIRVRYNGLDKKFTVKAYACSIDRIEVEYCGPTAVYEGNEIPKDTSVLMVTVYYKHPYKVSLLLSNFEVSYDTYHIVPGEDHEIYVYYKGVKSSKPIHVLGLADGLKEIKKVEYRGSKESGTGLKKEDFYVELGYLSGKTVTSEENPAILDKLSFSSDKLTEGENNIKVVYDGTLTREVNVVTNGIDVTGTPVATIAPGDVPKDGVATQTPLETVSPLVTSAPGDAVEGGAVTQTPTGTASPVVSPTISPLAQPQKGGSFTVQGVNYKVTGVTKKGGSVSVTGYDKKASKVKLQTAVSLNGYQYTVTKIEKGAFKNCSKLSGTISLTKNVKVVGDSAFYGCKNIKTVVFGSNVTQIGKSSFGNCSKLSTIQFKTGSVKKIGKNAFKGISKKYTVKTPKALKKTYAKRLKGAI